ncbi:DUF58 domain-containing protein [Planctomicrobium sp. SH668]|uniref:DUF58 domain-containing protein n=1 Tax=Planctomicrobium sp. SH668 TaxID=3448126 RepID=UPI003F5CAE83
MMGRRSWLARKLLFFIQFKLTPVGRMAVFLMFLSAIGLITTEIPIYQVFCAISSLFGIAELTGMILRPKLRITSSLPEKIVAGDSAHGFLTVENHGLFPAFDVSCGCFVLPPGITHLVPDTTIQTIPRGKQVSIPVVIHAENRGEYVLSDIFVFSTFPLNIMRTGATQVPPHKLIVVPKFHPLEHLSIPLSHRYQHGGLLLESHSGNAAAEYVGNRDYIPGEPTKRLDFRAWARVGKPVVREYQDEFCTKVVVILDTHVPSAGFLKRKIAKQQWDAGVSLTAAIIDSLDRSGITIEMFGVGDQTYDFKTFNLSQSSLENSLDILAGASPSNGGSIENLSSSIAAYLESTSVVIFLVFDWDHRREELVQEVLQSGCGVRIFLVSDQATTLPFSSDESSTRVSPRVILEGEQCSL